MERGRGAGGIDEEEAAGWQGSMEVAFGAPGSPHLADSLLEGCWFRGFGSGLDLQPVVAARRRLVGAGPPTPLDDRGEHCWISSSCKVSLGVV